MQQQIADFVKKILNLDFEPKVEVPAVSSHGHYSTNVAMVLAKTKGRSPLELAQELALELNKEQDKRFSKIEVAGAGFINFWLSKDFLIDGLSELSKKGIKKLKIGKGKTVIVEYPSINIAKPAHIGHLRSGVIGSALANIYELLGYKVIRWDYVGDWGTQFGKLIAAYKMWGSKKDVEEAPIETLLSLYVRFHDEARSDPTLEDKGKAEFAKLEKGDPENRKLWEWFKKESFVVFDKFYKRLGFKIDNHIGEAFFQKELGALNAELKKTIAKQSEGAWIVPLDEYNPTPALIEKADGATLYLTRDLALLRYRLKKYKPYKILHVVANEQTLHFQQVALVAQKMGMITKEQRPVHVKFGMVLGEDGKKFSTREGKAVKLEDLVNKIVALARRVVEEKNPDLSEAEKDKIAEVVGIGALKYSDLKENRNSDIVFDWNRMLDLRGDTAPYLQYTAVRMRSILRKSEIRSPKFKKKNGEFLKEAVELDLMKKFLDFNDVVKLCASQYMTSHLAKYLYELASLANQFYEQVRILEDADGARKGARLVLVAQTIKVLEKGLELLGIKVPERI